MIARSPDEQAGQSCHGLLWSSLGCVGCFFSARVFAPARHRAGANAANRRSRAFRGLPSAHGFADDCYKEVRSGSCILMIEREATSLPSPALQRIRAIRAWSIRAISKQSQPIMGTCFRFGSTSRLKFSHRPVGLFELRSHPVVVAATIAIIVATIVVTVIAMIAIVRRLAAEVLR
jgi:hypothetical protein